MNDGDVRIWSSLGKDVFISISSAISLGSPLKGFADLVHGPSVFGSRILIFKSISVVIGSVTIIALSLASKLLIMPVLFIDLKPRRKSF